MDYRRIAQTTIPHPNGKSSLKYANGYTADIMHEVLNCYHDSKTQLSRFAPYLRRATLLETCRAIWQFVHNNIAYKIDPPGKQFIKEPARLWADRQGDCKSFSLFIASCLYNLGINGMFRFVSFSKSKLPTHVYVVVPHQGHEIIIDAVLPVFNRQKPYTYKYDYSMTEISRLSGIADYQQPVYSRSSGRIFSVMGEEDESPNVSGFFDGLLGVNKKHVKIWRANLPQVCVAYLYVFIPDDKVSAMPQAVQKKRALQIESLKYIDNKADKAYSYKTAVKELETTIRNSFGMGPVDVIKATFGVQIGILPAVAIGIAKAAVAVYGLLKNVVGKFGTFGFDFPKHIDPSQIAPAKEDWQDYQVMDTTSLQATAATNNTTAAAALTTTGSDASAAVTPIITPQQSSMNILVVLGLAGAAAYMLFK